MRIDFRQGIVSKQSNFLQINGSGNIDLVASNEPVRVAIAHKQTDYLFSEPATVTNAWTGPFDPATRYWLYWDFDLLTFERTFGKTTLQPLVQATEPTSGTDSDGQAILQDGRIWYDTSTFTHYVYQSGGFRQVLRVFAAELSGGNNFSTVSINTNFQGTQIGVTTSTFAGRVLFDDSGNPIKKGDGTFFTTESDIFAEATRVDALRLESNVIRAQSIVSNIAKFTAIAWDDVGEIRPAVYNDIGETVVGILLEDTGLNQVGSIIIQGSVTNPDWDFSGISVGSELWIDDSGQLTATDPHTQDVSAHPQKKVPVARVLDKDTVIFEQGLGGVGPRGPQGTFADLEPATTSQIGGVLLSSIPASADDPVVVADTDPRLSDARPPTAHTHPATEVTFTPGGSISANNAQGALLELSSEKVQKSGDTMSGFLTLNADPTSNLHAVTKRYVDALASGLRWLEPICVLNMISDDQSTPPMSPVTGDSYIIPSGGGTGAWSTFNVGDVTTWDGTQWIDRGPLTGLSTGDPRVGIALDTPTTAGGSFAGHDGEIATYNSSGVLQSFYQPSENDAVFVCSGSDVYAFFQYAYDGTQWIQFGGMQAIAILDDIGNVNVPSPTDGQALVWDNSAGQWIAGGASVEFLNDITDVNAPSPTDGEALIWDSNNTEWIAGSAGATVLDELNDVESASAITGNILMWDGNDWVTVVQRQATYSLQTATSDNISFDTSSQGIQPRGVAFSDTGSKMFTADYGESRVFQYSVATPFDLSTVSYDSVSLDVSLQAAAPGSLEFIPTGSRFFLLDSNSEAIYQYDLSTPYDLSTASYNSVSLTVTSQDSFPTALTINNDGTKIYVSGLGTESIYEYDLSTPYDLASASYNSISLNVSNEETDPVGIAFNGDGSNLYVYGSQNKTVYEYDLTTAFDISTASYNGVSFNPGQDSTGDVLFSADGSKLYVSEIFDALIHQYSSATVGSPNDGDTIVWDSGSGEWVASISGISISDNGITLVSNASDVNFNNYLNVTDDNDGTVTIDVPVTGVDANVVTGTTGVSGNIVEWNTDGDAVDGGIATSSILTDITSESIGSLSDVDTSGVSDADVLTYNSSTSTWVAQAPSGGGVTTLDGLSDVEAPSPTDGQLLTFVQTSGTSQWTFTGHTNSVFGLAVEPDGSAVYSGGYDGDVFKIDTSGNQVWQYDGGTRDIEDLEIDSSNNVYAVYAGDRIQKLDSSGNPVWSFTAGDARSVAIASDGSVGYVAEDTFAPQIRKFDGSGNEITTGGWPLFYSASNQANDVEIDSAGNVYAGIHLTGEILKIDSSGNELWTYTASDGIRRLAVDTNGNTYGAADDGSVHKVDSTGSNVWTFTGHTDAVTGIAVDGNGNVYTASQDGTVRELDSSGNQVTSFSSSFSGGVATVAVDDRGDIYAGGGEFSTPGDTSVQRITSISPQSIWQSQTLQLDDVDNVNAPSPSDGQALVYDGNNNVWTAGQAGATTLNDLNDVNAPSPSDGEALTWDSNNTEWTASQLDISQQQAPYDIVFFISGSAAAQLGDTVSLFVATKSITIAGSALNVFGYAKVAPSTNDVTYDILLNGSSTGNTITFLVGSNIPTNQSLTNTINVTQGDRVELLNSTNTDPDIEDVGISIIACAAIGTCPEVVQTFVYPAYLGNGGVFNVNKLDLTGSEASDPNDNWPISFGGIHDLEEDSTGHIYVSVSDGSGGGFGVSKFDADANIIWSYSPPEFAETIATTPNGQSLYATIGGSGTTTGESDSLVKIDNSGSLVWSEPFTTGRYYRNIGYDEVNNYVYAVDVTNSVIRKFDPSTGSEITTNNWPYIGLQPSISGGEEYRTDIRTLTTKNGYVYSGAEITRTDVDPNEDQLPQLHKIDSTGSQVWAISGNGPYEFYSIAVDNKNYVYSAHFTGSNFELNKHNPGDGTMITSGNWPYIGMSDINDIKPRKDGSYIYVAGGTADSEYTFRKIDSTGAEVTSESWPYSSPSIPYFIAVTDV